MAAMNDHLSPQAVELTTAEMRRYSRHLILPDFGLAGQKMLKAARVLIIGAGGLGSPVSLYLAAAGVGTLGLVDYDRVDETNLQRQIAHGTARHVTHGPTSANKLLQQLAQAARPEPLG